MIQKENSPTIDSLQTEIKGLKQLVQSLNTLFKATLQERETMVSHIASASAGFWEISVPYEKIHFIRNSHGFETDHVAGRRSVNDFLYLGIDEKIRLRNRLEKTGDAPINYFEYTLAVGGRPLRLQGRSVEWDNDGLPTKLIGIYVELPDEKFQASDEGQTVVVCSQCREFRKNEFEWENLEDFMLSSFGIKVSYGLCSNCSSQDG